MEKLTLCPHAVCGSNFSPHILLLLQGIFEKTVKPFPESWNSSVGKRLLLHWLDRQYSLQLFDFEGTEWMKKLKVQHVKIRAVFEAENNYHYGSFITGVLNLIIVRNVVMGCIDVPYTYFLEAKMRKLISLGRYNWIYGMIFVAFHSNGLWLVFTDPSGPLWPDLCAVTRSTRGQQRISLSRKTFRKDFHPGPSGATGNNIVGILLICKTAWWLYKCPL